MTRLAEEDDPRLARQKLKQEQILADHVEKNDVRGAEGGEDEAGERNEEAQGSSTAVDVEVQPEDDNAAQDEEMEIMETQRAVLLTFLRQEKHVEVPERRVNEIMAVYSLLLQNGVKEDQARAKLWEFYSPPRVTAEANKHSHLNINGEKSFDMHYDKDGNAWDFRVASHRARARRQVIEEKPFMLVGSPPCTDWCLLNVNCNHPKMAPEVRARRMVEARVHLRFCIELYKLQLRGGRHFLHEHPSSARSWQEREMKELRDDPRVGEVIGHMCQYGMAMKDKAGTTRPVKMDGCHLLQRC